MPIRKGKKKKANRRPKIITDIVPQMKPKLNSGASDRRLVNKEISDNAISAMVLWHNPVQPAWYLAQGD